MISITSQVSSTYVVKFKELSDSEIEKFTRRVSRVATLDGGSVVTDSGFSDTDRTLKIKARITEDQQSDLEYMQENYALWNVVAKNEYFSCSPQRMKCDNGKLELTLLVES